MTQAVESGCSPHLAKASLHQQLSRWPSVEWSMHSSSRWALAAVYGVVSALVNLSVLWAVQGDGDEQSLTQLES
jgi:hypothetical protein